MLHDDSDDSYGRSSPNDLEIEDVLEQLRSQHLPDDLAVSPSGFQNVAVYFSKQHNSPNGELGEEIRQLRDDHYGTAPLKVHQTYRYHFSKGSRDISRESLFGFIASFLLSDIIYCSPVII